MNYYGRLAQLARAPRLHRGGRRFDSYIAHHWITAYTNGFFVETIQRDIDTSIYLCYNKTN